MNDPLSMLKSLTRPQLLVTAAKVAGQGYQREKTLRRLLKTPAPAGHNEATVRLLMLEQEHETARKLRLASYSAAKHVAVLGALMAEGRALDRRARQVQAKASATSCLRVVT